MKQNLIIVLLTVTVTLLLVNLYVGKFSPVAHADGFIMGGAGTISCAETSEVRKIVNNAISSISCATRRDLMLYCRH